MAELYGIKTTGFPDWKATVLDHPKPLTYATIMKSLERAGFYGGHVVVYSGNSKQRRKARRAMHA